MTYRMVTCPETAHLEMIEYEDSPLGMLISACTRFRPASQVTCPRTCSALMDRRAREAAAAHGDEDTCEHVMGPRTRPFVLEATSLLRRP